MLDSTEQRGVSPPSVESWQRGHLKDVIADVRGGFSVNCEDRPAGPDELGVLKTGSVLNGRFRPEENKAVLPSDSNRVRTPVAAGTIIICRKNSEEVIGASALVEESHPNLFLSDLLWQITPAKNVSKYWLAAILASDAVRASIRLASTGTQASMKNISQDRLLAIPVSIPPRAEQERVAEILREWDRGISKANSLIQLREVQFFALRDHLINWSSLPRSPLKEFLTPISRPVTKPEHAYRALSIRSHGKGTFERLVEDPASVEMEMLYALEAGDVVVNITFAWEGAVALVPPEHSGCLVSHRFPAFIPIDGKAHARYLHHMLRTRRFTHLLGMVSPGGAGRNRVLNKSSFLDLEVPMPELAEQARLATVLDEAERLIKVETKYRDALIKQKRGLMQKLLTGEWRVKGAA